jgi:hypothetical protein
MKLSCRTGPLRVGRSLRDAFTGRGGDDGFGPPVGRNHFLVESSAVAAEAVDEAAVALAGAFGWGGGPGDGAEEFSFFGGFAAGLFALVGFAVEGLSDGGGGALLA